MMKLPVRPKKVLIIRLSSLGDIVLTTLMIRCLRRKLPDAVIDMIAKAQFRPLLDMIDSLDNRYEYPKYIKERRLLWRELSVGNYDTVIDLQNNFVSRGLTLAVKPSRVFRYSRSRLNRWIRIHVPSYREKLTIPPHVAIGYLNTIKGMGVLDDGRGLELNVKNDDLKSAERLLNEFTGKSEIQDNNPPLILAPGARHKTKIWQEDRWIELIKMAFNDGLKKQVLIGSPSEKDLLESIADRLDFPVLMTAGKTGIGEMAALISMGKALVTNDSAPMHIASAVGTPLVAIYGPTVPEFGFSPFRCRSEVVQIEEELSCRPCHPHGTEECPKGHFRCMNDIDASEVYFRLKKLI
ncbi:MAG: glycosyltransferase family 9 protein [Calditrichaeota bacterium]|nr:glycosyltransferase family 9 protein [Calditrichota bacterium]